MTQRAPLRWLDAASDATPELRAAVGHARRDGPSEAQLERLMSGVIAQLPAPAEPSGANGAAAASAGLRALRWLLPLAIGAGLAVMLNHRLQATPAPIGRSHTAPATASRPVASPTSPQPEPPAQTETVAAPTPRSEATKRSVQRTAAPATVQDPGAEIALLQQARRALASAPAQALALTQSHARLFPDGTFREEREALAVEALLALGRHAEANARAHALLERYPQSAYRRRIERLLAGAP